jgi:nucleoside-diphosphate-sugar epimerase
MSVLIFGGCGMMGSYVATKILNARPSDNR